MTGVDRPTSGLIGYYRIARELGQGGMTTAYLAEDVEELRGTVGKW